LAHNVYEPSADMLRIAASLKCTC